MTTEQKSFLLGFAMRSTPFKKSNIQYEQNSYGQTAILIVEEENEQGGTTIRIGGVNNGS